MNMNMNMANMKMELVVPQRQPSSTGANKLDKSGKPSDFQKKLENSSKNPRDPGVGGKQPQEAQQSTGQVKDEQGMDMTNAALQAAAMLVAAAILPTIVQPEEQPAEQMLASGVAEQTLEIPMEMTTMLPEQQTLAVQQVEVAAHPEFVAKAQVEVQPQQTQAEIELPMEGKPEVETVLNTVKPQEELQVKQDVPEFQQVVQEESKSKEPEMTVYARPERPVFEAVQHTPIQVAEPVRADVPEFPAHLAERIEQAVLNGNDTIEVQLTPRELGTITIRLSVTDKGTMISMHSANSKTVSLLAEHAANIGALVERSQSGNVTVTVERDQPNGQQQQPYDQEQQGGRQQQQQQQRHHAPPQSDDFIQQLRLGLSELERV